MYLRGTPEWDDGQYDAGDDYMERSIELMHLAEQLMSDTPGLGRLDAHFEAVGMLDSLLAYAAQWDADAAAERNTR